MKINSKGFTLIELLVVIAIIGTLASIVFASLSASRSKARDTQKAAQISEIKTAMELFYSDYGFYPRTVGGSIEPLDFLRPSLTPNYITTIPDYLVDEHDYISNSTNYGYAMRVYFENAGAFGSDSAGQCKTGVKLHSIWFEFTPMCDF